MRRTTSPLFSLFYNILVSTYIVRKVRLLSKIWFWLWNYQKSKYKGLILTNLHGYKAIVPNGHWYVLVCKVYPKFNSPLVALCREVILTRNHKINIIDVGAAVGDTVFLLESNFGQHINHYLCIDGDEEYIEIITENLKIFSERCTVISALISDKNEEIPEIIKIDPTTGSANGTNKTTSKTADEIILGAKLESIDLIKIDIDGFDGKAIGGLTNVLALHQPPIIFEWNPPLYHLVQNDIFQPFEVLSNYGYDVFLWYSNTGHFSHYEIGSNKNALKFMSDYCEAVKDKSGAHFDIIAIHRNDKINVSKILT
jgi:FkbM family methyltransferase